MQRTASTDKGTAILSQSSSWTNLTEPAAEAAEASSMPSSEEPPREAGPADDEEEEEEVIEYVEEEVEYEEEEASGASSGGAEPQAQQPAPEEQPSSEAPPATGAPAAEATMAAGGDSGEVVDVVLEQPAAAGEEEPGAGAEEALPTSSGGPAGQGDAAVGAVAPAGAFPAATDAAGAAAPQQALDDVASASSGAAGVDLDIKALEAQASKVAKDVTQAAKDMSNKLSAGLRSAFGTSEAAGNATAGLKQLAGGLSSWWGSLDPTPQPVRDETAERVAAANANKASGELQQLFGLSGDENLVEHFKCKLLQTYACNHNQFTPAIQMAFQGTLYVTDRHTCFSVEERGRKLPFKVAHSQVTKATRQRPARKGDLSDVLKMELSSGQFLSFKDFENGSALDSALALVEHLTEGSSGGH